MRSFGYCVAESLQSHTPEDFASSYEQYCQDGGHVATAVFSEITGTGPNKEWEAMLESIEDSQLGYLVVVPDASHLGISLWEQVTRLLELDSLACQVLCMDSDYPDPLQDAVRAGKGPQSRGERIREGMRAKAAKGLGLGKPPYGYKIMWDGRFEVVPEEAAVVRSMYSRYLEEPGGVRTVASWLNDSGCRTRRGHLWSMVTVRDVLRNTAYIGTYRRFGLRLPATYVAIVDREIFRRVQDKMQQGSRPRRGGRNEAFLLSGIIYCGYCGQRMMGVTRHQGWRRKDGQRVRSEYRYYQCQSRVNRDRCEYRTVIASDLELAVLNRVTDGIRNMHPEARESDSVSSTIEEVVNGLRSRIASVERRYRAVVERAASGGMSMPQLRVVTVETGAELRTVHEQLAIAEAGPDGVQQLVEVARERFLYLWNDLELNERQEILRRLVSKIVVKDRRIQVIL